MFPEPTIVRLEGATAGGSALKIGWILVGFHMEMWLGPVRIRSSRVRFVSVSKRPEVQFQARFWIGLFGWRWLPEDRPRTPFGHTRGDANVYLLSTHS